MTRQEIVRKSQAKRRARFKELGLCIQCGKVPPVAGRTLCKACNEKQKENVRRYKCKKSSNTP